MQGNCRAEAACAPHQALSGAYPRRLAPHVTSQTHSREVDAWTVLIHDVPETSSSLLPRTKSVCVVNVSLCGTRFSTGSRGR
jgi:hypothetical protein